MSIFILCVMRTERASGKRPATVVHFDMSQEQHREMVTHTETARGKSGPVECHCSALVSASYIGARLYILLSRHRQRQLKHRSF